MEHWRRVLGSSVGDEFWGQALEAKITRKDARDECADGK